MAVPNMPFDVWSKKFPVGCHFTVPRTGRLNNSPCFPFDQEVVLSKIDGEPRVWVTEVNPDGTLGESHNCGCSFWGDAVLITKNKKGIMENIVKRLKDLVLSKTDRLLRESEFEDENGKMTSMARDMMVDELVDAQWKARREDIATNLSSIKDEDKK